MVRADGSRGSWLEGPSSARPLEPDFYPGKRLGLPEHGPGSIAGFGARIGAYLIDALIAGMIGGIFNGARSHPSENIRGVAGVIAFVVMTAVLLSTAGQTIGMRMLRLRLAPVSRLVFPWALGVVMRTLLLTLVIPAVIYDRDRRGLHDKLAGSAVVRS